MRPKKKKGMREGGTINWYLALCCSRDSHNALSRDFNWNPTLVNDTWNEMLIDDVIQGS